MADSKISKDQQDYQDFLDYQEFIASQEPANEPQQDSSFGGSAARGFTDISTLGYAPQIAGALDPLAGWLAKKIDPGVAEQIKPRSYVEARDEYNQQIAADTEQQRLAQLLGKGAGLAANVAIPVGMFKAAGPGAWNAAKVGAKTGALYGGLSNPGDVEGQIDPLQIEQRAKGAGIGALLGGGMGAAGSKLADWWRGSSQRQAVKSLNAKPEVEAELQALNAGKTLQEEGLARNPFRSPAERIEDISGAIPKYEQQQQALLNEAERRGVQIDATKVGKEALSKLPQAVDPAHEASLAPVRRNIEGSIEMAGGRQKVQTTSQLPRPEDAFNHAAAMDDYQRALAEYEGSMAAHGQAAADNALFNEQAYRNAALLGHQPPSPISMPKAPVPPSMPVEPPTVQVAGESVLERPAMVSPSHIQQLKKNFQNRGFESEPTAIKVGDTATANAYKIAQGPYREAVEKSLSEAGIGNIKEVNNTLHNLYSAQQAVRSGGVDSSQALGMILRSPINTISRLLNIPAFRASLEPRFASMVEKAISSKGQATIHRAANTGRGGK